MISQLAKLIGAGYDATALNMLRPLERGYLSWSSSSMRPGAVASILNDVVINDRRTIVEFGSGISTIYLARTIQDMPDRSLISFEHDPNWAAMLTDRLREEGALQRVSIIDAPLEPNGKSPLPWYSMPVVRNALNGLAIDCVVCDGPPAYASGYSMARRPAVPIVSPYLSDRYAIFLDDVDRVGERQIIKEWSQILQIQFQTYLIKGSFALGCKGSHFHAAI